MNLDTIIDIIFSSKLNIGVIIVGAILTLLLLIVYKRKENRQNGRDVLSYIPTIWTSLGILGTFIAIVGTLHKGATTIDIPKLINDIIPAFVTSIIGIIGAIISSIGIKIMFARWDQSDDDEENTPEYTLRNIERLLEESIYETQSQTTCITETLSNQSKILKTFVDDFIKKMDSIFKDMKESIEKQTEAFGKEQYEKTSAITTALLSQFVHTQTNLINNFTEHSKILLENNNAKFEQVSTGLNEKVTEMKREMSDNITALSTSVTDHFNSLLQRLQGTCSDFQGSLKEFSDDLKKNYGFIDDKAGQIVKNYEQSAEAYKDAVQNAHDTNKQASKLLESVQEYMENCNKTNQKVIYTLNVLDERQENINNLVARIQEMSTAIETLQNIENQLNRLNQ